MARLIIPGYKTQEERRESRQWESRLLRLEALVVKYSRDRKAAIDALGVNVKRELSLARNIARLVKENEELRHELAQLRQGGAVPGPRVYDALGSGEAPQTHREGDQS